MKILISHFYNEEYLLPFWLEHHKNLFDIGILINYHSTDNSVNIIKKITPNWIVLESKNDYFSADLVDQEVMEIESKFNGIKLVLNTTEFLICKNIEKLFNFDDTLKCKAIRRFTMVQKFDFCNLKNPIWKYRFYGYKDNNNINGLYRFIHNHRDGQYKLGRHDTSHDYIVTPKAIILWYGFSPINIQTIKRKLQIKKKIPQNHFEKGIGFQHNVNVFKLFKMYLSQFKNHKIQNLKKEIEFLLND